MRDFAHKHEKRILFHGWLQWLIDGQLGAVQKHARASGMKIGLYHDLALATDSCGSDLWAHRPFFVTARAWDRLPTASRRPDRTGLFLRRTSAAIAENGYRLYMESIRKSMRHGGALRIDHVMRLFRLYWIPEGHERHRRAHM